MKPINLRPPEFSPPNSEAMLCAEIAERLCEWSQVSSRARVTKWLRRALTLHEKHPYGFWIYMQWQSGDQQWAASSLTAAGESNARSKQGEHQERRRALDAIREIMPDVAEAIEHRQDECGAGKESFYNSD